MMLIRTQMTYMAPDSPFFTAALVNDGLVDVVEIGGKHSFMQYMKMFTAVEKGKFFDNPLVSYRKVSAYRVTPHQDKGYVSVDGEHYDFKPFQVEVHRGLGTVLTQNGMLASLGPWNMPETVADATSADELVIKETPLLQTT